MSRSLGLVALIVASTLTAACSGASASGAPAAKSTGGTQAVEIKAADTFKFDPPSITVKAGAPVRLTLSNSGALEHDWVVDSLEGKKVEADAKPKSSASVEFTPTAARTYEYYCSVPGHRDAGMKGTLVVQ